MKFAWGKVIDRFEYDFDGHKMEVTKYRPHKRQGNGVVTREFDTEKIEYHCQELHASAATMFGLVLEYIVWKQLGNNQHQLVAGLYRMLEIGEEGK